MDNAKVVLRDMRELRTAGALAQSPGAGRCRFQTFVHLDVSTGIQGYARLLETDILSYWGFVPSA